MVRIRWFPHEVLVNAETVHVDLWFWITLHITNCDQPIRQMESLGARLIQSMREAAVFLP